MQDLMGSFRKFLKERKLKLSFEKSKLLVFNRKRKKGRKNGNREKKKWRSISI